jgi:hypothetical protein
VVRAIDAKASPIGEARYAFGRRTARPKPRSTCRSNCATTFRGWKFGERSAARATARQAMAATRHRRRHGAPATPRSRLLASTFYLTRALSPFADVRLGDRGAPQQVIAQFLDQRLPMIVLADVGTLSPEIRER